MLQYLTTRHEKPFLTNQPTPILAPKWTTILVPMILAALSKHPQRNSVISNQKISLVFFERPDQVRCTQTKNWA